MSETPENTAAAEEAIQTGEQAQTITVPFETPADDGELLAGKFENTDELVKAYKALETKLGENKQEGAEETPADKEAEQEQETKDDEKGDNDGAQAEDGDPYADYGETVGNALKSAEVDPLKAQEEFAEKGTLSDESFEKFDKAGFPKEMVEAYLRGVTAVMDGEAATTEADIASIKAVVGGEAEFTKLQQWMASNADPKALEAYNSALEAGDVSNIKTAVSNFHTAYQKDIGHEGELVRGRAPAAEAGYASEAEYLEDVAKQEYKDSQVFRDKVRAKLERSPAVFMTL
ncbi:capsid assembly protein [Pseudovibrio ascidiaceicola]|uniref:capsid assembly protein n=1 Tax=Pseudovibrio ascidiaceicola TaxID=285279 RepID=UPI003D362F9C